VTLLFLYFLSLLLFFFYIAPLPSYISTLSLHDALPILYIDCPRFDLVLGRLGGCHVYPISSVFLRVDAPTLGQSARPVELLSTLMRRSVTSRVLAEPRPSF